MMQTFDFFGSQGELGEMGMASFRKFCVAVEVTMKHKDLDMLFLVCHRTPAACVLSTRVLRAHVHTSILVFCISICIVHDTCSWTALCA